MGLGQKIKGVLHHDHPSKTYEDDHPPGAFPSETTDNTNTNTTTKRSNVTDGRDYKTLSTNKTYDPADTTNSTSTHPSRRTGANTGDLTSPNTHGGATSDAAAATAGGRASHRQTDSGIDVGHGHGSGRRKDVVADDYDYHYDNSNSISNSIGERGSNTSQDPYWGTMGRETHGVTGKSAGVRTGYDDPAGTHGPHGNRAANVADPRVDSDRDHRGAPVSSSGYTSANKDLPLRPSDQRDIDGSGYGSGTAAGRSSATAGTGGGPPAFGGGVYNATSRAAAHHDPTSSIDRSVEGRDFTHAGYVGNAGSGGGGNQGGGYGEQFHGVHQNGGKHPSLMGANSNDPYDTRMRDRDMGRDRTGHGLAGAGVGAGVGMAASDDAARRHHHDDMRDSGYSPTNSSGGYNSPVNRGGMGGVDGDYSRSGLTGHEPGVPRTTMLDPYNESTNLRGGGSDSRGFTSGGSNGSPTFSQSPRSGRPDHYGPGHEGSKVMHTCAHCGRDNDISRYFKKDTVYRAA